MHWCRGLVVLSVVGLLVSPTEVWSFSSKSKEDLKESSRENLKEDTEQGAKAESEGASSATGKEEWLSDSSEVQAEEDHEQAGKDSESDDSDDSDDSDSESISSKSTSECNCDGSCCRDRGLASERVPTEADADSETFTNGIAPDKALSKLKIGNQRFVQGRQRSRQSGMAKKDRIRLLAGESPHTVVITTSDSRVSPELLFDQRLGEIYVIRVLGPALGKSVIASIEYAVKTLGVQFVLVLGSENSAGVKSALMNPIGATSLGSPYVGFLLRDIQPRVSQFHRRPASSGYSREGAANARGIVKDLIRKSTILRARVGSGALQMHSAMYYLDSGVVDFH